MSGGLAPDGVFWHRQQGLLQVLKAYTLYRPEQGYCQAQGPVAAVLLMYLPPEVSELSPAWRPPPSIPSDLDPHQLILSSGSMTSVLGNSDLRILYSQTSSGLPGPHGHQSHSVTLKPNDPDSRNTDPLAPSLIPVI